MRGRSRKNYPAAWKVQVALAALKGDKTLAEFASEFGSHPNQIQPGKKHVLSEAPSLFASRRRQTERETAELQAELYRQIGQLKVELD